MSKTDNDLFLVIGMGASAGGLQALQHFFETMPSSSGVAFVIVTHLATAQESHLTELISAHTTMPVLQVQDAVKLERNHVYVIPPNRNLSTIDSSLRLTPMEEARRDRAPIDHFFRTLADSHGEYAVGIVFSGTGSDGTIGLQCIKEAGGLTVVQEPTEAAYDGMPLSAIASGLVDLVLPIHAMPARLLDYVTNALAFVMPDEEAATPAPLDDKGEQAALRQILAQVRRQTGQDFARYKRSTILRRILRRVQIHQLADLPAYAAFLQAHHEEVAALYQNLLISVTNFFRDAAVFTRLEQAVIPQLFTGKAPNEQVRVWVAGCATGEEAYSLAILLLEQASQLDPPISIQVFATDLSESALLRARAGVYPETIAADVSAERLARFFSREGSGYRVNQRLRECVLFAPHNLLKDPPFSKLDLIACRNLLIYLNRDTHAQIFELFYYALRPDGYLLLSPSESTERTDLFHAIHQKLSIFQRTTSAALTPRLPTLAFSPTTLPPLSVPATADKQVVSYGALHQRLVERYAPPSILVNADYIIVHLSEHAGRYLQDPGGEPTQHLLKRIHPALQLELTSALYGAVAQQRALRGPPIRIDLAGASRRVDLLVLPALDPELQGYALVIFEESEAPSEPADAVTATAAETATRANAMSLQLAAELERAKQQLRTTIEEFETNREEMRAGHEELLSINEELKSTTEELETGKEELQSINEELFTTNAELKFKIDELGRANSDLLNLMAATDVGVIFLDRALRVKRFTPPAAALFHLIDSDLERPFAHIAHRLYHRRLPELAAHVLATQIGVEEIEQSATGRWYILRLFPYRTVANVVEGVVITFVDISELKRAEHELKLRIHQSAIADLGRQALQGGELPALLTAVTTAVVDILDLAFGQVLALQAAGQSLVQMASVGWPALSTADSTVTVSSNAHVAYTLQINEPVLVDNFQTETRFSQTALFARHGIVSGASMIIPGRAEPYGVLTVYSQQPHTFTNSEVEFLESVANLVAVAIVRKVTEDRVRASEARLQQLNATLEQRVAERTAALTRSNHDLDQFAYVASHDLRSPLRAIDNLATWITEDAASVLPEPSLVHLHKLRGRIKRMDKLLDDLLAYSRIGRYAYPIDTVDTRRLLNDLIALMAPPGFIFTLDEKSPVLTTTRASLEIVLRNLISNAIKHHHQTSGHVSVTVRELDHFIEFAVTDDGPGIAEEYHTRIFELFQTLKPRDQVEGSGIGLAVVKKIVESQAGAVSVESTEGGGACFRFTWAKQVDSAKL